MKKIKATKDVFSNIIKQIPSESYKKTKIDYDQSNNINIDEVKNYEPDYDDEFFWYKKLQNSEFVQKSSKRSKKYFLRYWKSEQNKT